MCSYNSSVSRAVTTPMFPAQFLQSCPVPLQIPHFLTERVLLKLVLIACSSDPERDRAWVASWDWSCWLLATILKLVESRRVLVRWLIAERLRPKAPTGRPRVPTMRGFWIAKIPLDSVAMLDSVFEIPTYMPISLSFTSVNQNQTRTYLLVRRSCFIHLPKILKGILNMDASIQLFRGVRCFSP